MSTALTAYAGARASIFVPYLLPHKNTFDHHRLGIGFHQEPQEIPLGQLGDALEDAVSNLIVLASDPHLSVTLIRQDGTEQVLGEAEIAAIQADLAQARDAGLLCKRCGGVRD